MQEILADIKKNIYIYFGIFSKTLDYFKISAYKLPQRLIGIKNMETRVALIAVLLKNREASTAVNTLLHDYAEYIIGRFGLPYRQKGLYIISVAIDAPQDIISALSGKIGALKDVSAKTVYSDC